MSRLSPVALAESQTIVLRAIHDAQGKPAFDRAARQLLFTTAGLIAAVLGRERLTDLMEAIDVAVPR